MSIHWTDQHRNTNKSFFNPFLDKNSHSIYHMIHCAFHYQGGFKYGKLTLICDECGYETQDLDSVIVKSISFAEYHLADLVRD